MDINEFNLIMKKYERLIFTVCHNFVKSYDDAMNLTQETFISAYYHIDGCDKNFYKEWLTRIAVNKSKDFLKSAYVNKVSVVGDDTISEFVTEKYLPEKEYIITENFNELKNKILSLKEPYKLVSNLYFLEEKSISEISQILKRPKKTVQTQIQRARSKLKEEILKEGEFK